MAADKRLQEKILKQIIGEVAVGLGHLHECGYNYGELSAKNVLINFDGHVLLVDLGACCRHGHPVRNGKEARLCSPEELSTRVVSTSADWWLLGLLICELLSVDADSLINGDVRMKEGDIKMKDGNE